MKLILKIALLLLIFTIIFFLGEKSVNLKKDVNSPIRAKIEKRHSNKVIELPQIELVMPPLDSLNSYTKKIIGLNKDPTKIDRNRLVNMLKGKELSKDDFQAFYTFINTSPGNDSSYLALHSIKNDLLTFLIEDGRYKESTGRFMLNVINDTNQHSVMREYTLQYVSDYFYRHWLDKSDRTYSTEERHLSSLDKQLQEEFVKTMYGQLNSSEGPIAGTALIRLNDISKIFSIVDKEKIIYHTEKMISNNSVPVSSRMAALTIANEKQLTHLQEEIQTIAFDQNIPVVLRMAALNTAGNLTQFEDFTISLKNKILSNLNEDKRILYAAKEIYKRLMKTKG